MCLGAQTPFITIHQCPTLICLLPLLQIIHVRYSLDVIEFFVGDVTAVLGFFYKVVKKRLMWRPRPSVHPSLRLSVTSYLVLVIKLFVGFWKIVRKRSS